MAALPRRHTFPRCDVEARLSTYSHETTLHQHAVQAAILYNGNKREDYTQSQRYIAIICQSQSNSRHRFLQHTASVFTLHAIVIRSTITKSSDRHMLYHAHHSHIQMGQSRCSQINWHTRELFSSLRKNNLSSDWERSDPLGSARGVY